MKAYKVELDAGVGACILKHIDDVAATIEPGELGDVYTVSIVEMSEEEIDALPEFDGW